jgi:uncharacterized protein involved in outer membrane biogenesis
MNKPLKIILVVVVVLVALSFIRDLIIKSSIEAGAKFVTGADVKIGGFTLGLVRQSVRVTQFKMFNPPGFPQNEVLVSIPEVAVRLDSLALLTGMLHVPYLRLDLEEVRVIKNKDGKVNVNSLKFAQQPTGQQKSAEKASTKETKMRLDLVSLNIGKVVMEDYSRGGAQPKVTEYNINLKNKEFKNITNPAQLGSAIMLEALTPAGLGNAFKLGAKAVDEVFAVGTTAVGGATKAIGGTTQAVTGTVDGLFKGVKGVLK